MTRIPNQISRKVNTTIEGDRQPEVFANHLSEDEIAPEQYVVDVNGKLVFLDFVTLDKLGITNEALLSIVIDRLEHFQDSKYQCEENAQALQHLNIALNALNERTRNRKLRGVEGTHKL